jgi:hypothetical protein
MNFVSQSDAGCWIWSGGNNGSYGVFRVGSTTDGSRRQVYAHRISYELHKGKIPAGLFVCHTCDVKLCVNPAHLFLGTNADNIRDHLNKGGSIGRSRHGEENPRAVLDVDQVRAIRRRYDCGESLTQLGRSYGVTKQAIYGIVLRKNWKHV